MEHENIDENAKYLTACENVKKIVNAIKLIKIKYYPNFSKISEKDKQVYKELEVNLEKISEDNNLNRLKDALMEEVSKKDIKDKNYIKKRMKINLITKNYKKTYKYYRYIIKISYKIKERLKKR